MERRAFREIARGRVVLVVDPELEDAALALGLLEPGAVERLAAAAQAGGAGDRTGRGPVAVVPLPGRPERIALRPLRHGGLLGPLLRSAFAGTARPRRELAVTAALRAAGAPVPRPALAVCERLGGPIFRCAVATVLEEASRDAVGFLAAAPAAEARLRACAAAGIAIRRFHDAGGSHPDLHVKNLLVREAAGRMEVVVIDLDRARIGPPPGAARRTKELMRLLRSLEKRGLADLVGPRGCAAFLAAYTAGDRTLRRALLHRAPFERLRNRVHALAWRARGS